METVVLTGDLVDGFVGVVDAGQQHMVAEGIKHLQFTPQLLVPIFLCCLDLGVPALPTLLEFVLREQLGPFFGAHRTVEQGSVPGHGSLIEDHECILLLLSEGELVLVADLVELEVELVLEVGGVPVACGLDAVVELEGRVA